jgi:Leucine-rich repeat (LRR) protein
MDGHDHRPHSNNQKKKTNAVTIEKLLRNTTQVSKIDFDALVQQHGFVKARQLIKRSTIEQHQALVLEEETNIHKATEAQRKHETIQRSSTQGSVSNIKLLDKVMASNRGIKELERMIVNGTAGDDGGIPSNLLHLIHKHEQTVQRDQYLDSPQIQYALTNPESALLISNANIEELPLDLADTLHLQISYLRKINCSRNAIKTLTSSTMPQFSFYHLRYVRIINLSLNKIRRLPDNFGALKYLEELNLSNNMISKLPASIFNLKTLRTLDLSVNSMAELPLEFSNLNSLTDLNLSQNLFMNFPYAICRLTQIRVVKFSRNNLNHLAVLPPLLSKEDMFIKTFDSYSGKTTFINILTKERVSHIAKYSGSGIKRQLDLHCFQSDDPKNILHYRRRKMWLSVCQVHEWEPDIDPSTGTWYFKNNVSGSTSWTLPPSLDNFGLMTTLQDLQIAGNAIKEIPPSFTQLQHLQRVNFKGNRLRAVPEDIGTMKCLEHFSLASNELKLLPISICDCPVLKELYLDDNHLVRLPERLGYTPCLEVLELTANRLRTVPFTLGYCQTLKTIRVAENPMEDPPIHEFDKHIDQIRWYLKNRFLIEERGMPPQMEFHTIGVNHEVTILMTELQETIFQKLEGARRDGFLNLSLLGLKEIPKQVAKNIKSLSRIKFDFNDKLEIDSFPIEFVRLEGLSFKSCKMPRLPDNIHQFSRLTTLNLEDNRIESLPEGFTELVTLTNLSTCCSSLLALSDC